MTWHDQQVILHEWIVFEIFSFSFFFRNRSRSNPQTSPPRNSPSLHHRMDPQQQQLWMLLQVSTCHKTRPNSTMGSLGTVKTLPTTQLIVTTLHWTSVSAIPINWIAIYNTHHSMLQEASTTTTISYRIVPLLPKPAWNASGSLTHSAVLGPSHLPAQAIAILLFEIALY